MKPTSRSVYDSVFQEILTKGRRLALNEQHHMGPRQNSEHRMCTQAETVESRDDRLGVTV